MRLVIQRGRRHRSPSPRPPGSADEYLGQIVSGEFDSEEVISSGLIFRSSHDLELGEDDERGPQLVGLIFEAVSISQGEPISKAVIEFTSDEDAQTAGLITRTWGEDNSDPAVFSETDGDLTNRVKTTTSVDRDWPTWNLDDAGENTQVEVTSIVQEIVNRGDWVKGKNMGFLTGKSPDNVDETNPRRSAYSADNVVSGKGARLVINREFSEPGGGGGDEPTAFSVDGLDKYDLTVNTGFDPDNPTLKDGTPITGDMLTYYNALVSWAESDPTGSWIYVNIVNRLSHQNIYEAARWGSNCWQAISTAYRLTGDPRLLDKLAEAAIAMRNSLVIPWDGYDQSAYESNVSGACFSDTPWSPYLKKLRVGSAGGTFWGTGTDGHIMNEERYQSLIVEMAWMFHVNRGKSTPGGYDFAAQADWFAGHCEDFIRKWSGKDDVGDCWENNYLGTNYKRSGRQRAGSGQWPFCAEQGDNHSSWEGLRSHHYWEALRDVGWDVPSGAKAQRDVYCDDLTDWMFLDCTTPYGDSIVWKRSWIPLGQSSDVALGATYMGYVSWSLLQIWLAGYRRDIFTNNRMVKITRSFADILHSDGGTDYSMIGSTNRCGLDAESSNKAIDAGSNAIKGLGAGLIAWDTPDDHINTVATTLQNNVAGGYSSPNSGLWPAGQFVAEALKVIGDT